MWGTAKIQKMSTSNANFSEKLLKKVLLVNSLIYIELSVLEMHVKPALLRAIQTGLGPGWLAGEITNPQVPLFNEEMALIRRRKSSRYQLTEKKFMQEASLGFWVELLSRETYKWLKGAPIQAFQHRPAAIKRNDLYVLFKTVKDLRNEIVHNRFAIGQKRESDLAFLHRLQKGHQDIRTILRYIHPPALRLLPRNIDEQFAALEALV
jgi:hypothetical protein